MRLDQRMVHRRLGWHGETFVSPCTLSSADVEIEELSTARDESDWSLAPTSHPVCGRGASMASIWQHCVMSRLLAEEVDHYRSQGWVIPAFRLPTAQVAAMASALDELLCDNPGVRPEKLVSAHIEGDNGEGVRGSRALPRPGARPRDRRAGERRARRRRHPVGLPRVLQARGRRLRDAVAPGRPLLADPPARQLHGVGGARALDASRTVACASSRARTPAGSCTSICTKIAAT